MWIFIGNVSKDCNKETIESHLTHITNKKDFTCEKIETYYDSNCYKIGVYKEYYDAILKPECWPMGIKLDKFIFKRRLGNENEKQNFHLHRVVQQPM